MQIYVKRGSVVQAEPYDPARSDQGVSPAAAGPAGLGVMSSRGRIVNVWPGDMIVTDELGAWPVSAIGFSALYVPLDEIVTPDADAITETGGNQ